MIANLGYHQEVYLTVNQDSISSTDFHKQYAANVQTEGKEQAIATYVDFSLLRQAAENTKIDTTRAFQKLFQQNIQPSRDKFLYDKQTEKDLIKEIWPKLQQDRKVEIYALGIENTYDLKKKKEREILIKELHEAVCKNVKPTQKVAEYLNTYPVKTLWLRPFTTSSEFENVTYDTTVGTCSAIQKSEKGNFFVKVLDQRVSAGNVELAYIYSKEKSQVEAALNAINSGMKWNDAKEKYGSYEGVNGYFGKPKFEADLPEPFYRELQKMDNSKYSQPFNANDGWYIIHLLKQEKFNQLDDWESWIAEHIKQSDYAMAFVKNSEKRANEIVKVEENATALQAMEILLRDDFFVHNKALNVDKNQSIWSSEHSEFDKEKMLNEMNLAKKYYDKNTDFTAFWNDIIPKFKQQFVLNEYIQNLAYYEPEYASDASLLRESILVNHYVDTFIFDAAKKDTLGLQNYLKNNADKYTWEERFDLDIFKFKNENDGKLILKMLKSGRSKEEILAFFEPKKDEKGALEVTLTTGKFEKSHEIISLIKNPKKKYHTAIWNQRPVIIRVNKIIPSMIKNVQEAGYSLEEDYKSYFYRQHLDKLRNDATIHLPKTF